MNLVSIVSIVYCSSDDDDESRFYGLRLLIIESRL